MTAPRAEARHTEARLRLDSTPAQIEVDDVKQHEYTVYACGRVLDLHVRLRLVEMATGRILWSDDSCTASARHEDTQIDPLPAKGIAGKTPALKAWSALRAEAVTGLRSALSEKATEVLTVRARNSLWEARRKSGESAVACYVRFLFDSPVSVDQSATTEAMDALFSPYLVGERLARCRKTVATRLGLGPHDNAPVAPTSAVSADR